MSSPAPTPIRTARFKTVIQSANAGLLQRKCACGSPTGSLTGECEECRAKQGQTKLRVGASNDPLELEADRIAERVLSDRAAPPVPSVGSASSGATGPTGTAPASWDPALGGPGSRLAPCLQPHLQLRCCHD